MKLLLVTILMLSGLSAARAQATLTARAAYDYLQAQRARAGALVGESTKPAVDSLQKGVRILQQALAYYHRPEVEALAKTSKSLYYRQSDILFDLAVLQAKLNQSQAAAASLHLLLTPEFIGTYLRRIRQEPALADAQREPDLQPALRQALTMNNVFDSPALATPYQPNLSAAEKVAGLSKMWGEAKYNFAYFDHLPGFNWDKLYLDYLPQVQATTSTLVYFRLLQTFYAQLHDGHTGVWTNDGPLADSVYSRPPLQAQLVEGHVLLRAVRSDSLRRTWKLCRSMTSPWWTMPTGRCALTKAAQPPRTWMCKPTFTAYFAAPKTGPVRLTFRDAKGHEFTRVLPRRGYGKPTPFVPVRLRFLPGNVAYLQVNEFETDAGLKRFVAAFDSIRQTSALIIDLRQNGGGNSGNGWHILGYLTDKPFLVGRYQSRTYSAVGRARGAGVQFEPVDTANIWSAAGGQKLYTKPVAVLISGETFSAAEDFCAA